MPLPNSTLYEVIYNNNQDNLDRTAIEYYGTNLSYGEMLHTIALLAGDLEASGIKEGDFVTVSMINSPETICLLFALNKIGAVANMVYGTSTLQELKKYILDTNTKVIFTLDLYQDKYAQIASETGIRQIIVTSLSRSMSSDDRKALGDLGCAQKALPNDRRFITWEQFFSNNKESNFTFDCPDAPAVVTYTGGTTGGSKGAIFSSRSILSVSCQYITCTKNLTRNSTWALTLPLFTAFGTTWSLMIPFLVGMTVIVRLPLMESITDLCNKFHANHIMHGPAYWEKLADDDAELNLSSLFTPFTAGDFLPPAIENKINTYLKKCGCPSNIINAYGLTEACTGVCSNFQYAHKEGSVGIPFCKNTIAAFDIENNKELPYEREGELCVITPSAMIGYVNNHVETNNILRHHNDGNVWIHTGDLGYIDKDGFVYISGRLKRYMNCVSSGVHKKVFSLDIEKVLLHHSFVEKCAVVPVNNPETLQAPVSFIVLQKRVPDNNTAERELTKYVEENLDSIYRPIKFFFVDSFPLTKLGKVDYRALEEIAAKNMNLTLAHRHVS